MAPENRRLLLAIVLTFAVIIAWSLLFQPPPRPGAGPGSPVPRADVGASPAPLPRPSPEAPAAREEQPGPGGSAEAPAAMAAEAPRSVRVRSRGFTVQLSNRCGVVERWTLEAYRASVPRPGETSGPVEVFSPEAATSYPPLALVTGDRDVDGAINTSLYETTALVVHGRGKAAVEETAAGDEIVLGEEDSAKVRFRWADGSGRAVEKAITLHGDSHVAEVSVRATTGTAKTVFVGIGVGVADWHGPKDVAEYSGRCTVSSGGSPERVPREKVAVKKLLDAAGGSWPPSQPDWLSVAEQAGQVRRFANVTWGAREENYFAAVAFAATPWREVLIAPVPDPVEKGRASLLVGFPAADFSLFVGPKDEELLEAVRPDLARVIDFGFFDWIARILLVTLKFFHRYVQNYGVAIILLTVVIKILFLPLTVKQLSMMMKMSRLRPQLKEIEDRYSRAKTDSKDRLEANRRKSAEIMALYQREGVNPASGCLPLLLQLPVLWGFYWVLRAAIELRHAPFALWIQDLSAKDPLYVTPVLMLISMIVMQAITPTSADPTQRRLMYVMPIIFAWVFKDLASGLVLYWLTQNVLSIVQQVWMNRLAEERQKQEKERKRLGRGKRA